MTKYSFVLLLQVISFFSFGQDDIYELKIGTAIPEINIKNLKFHGTNPSGSSLDVNSKYFIKDGNPWFPIMGEFHYTRFPEKYWEEQIVKMKSAGLSIVATYIFWNAHEYPKGTWNWEGIRDLRHFVELCHKHDMYVWLRIGPWSHGEQLYGGHPRWIHKMNGKRSNNSKYLAEVEKLYTQIGEQVEDQFFKDGGPIIGVQLENEYASGDPDHIGTLKAMALKSGIEPVYFTITANTVFHDEKFEATPLQGGYPYRGWERDGGKATKDFLYANDQWIMTDALGKVYYDVTQFPRGLCEQGCGSQMTYNNRFTVEPHVVEAHLQNQIGRGMNLIGYYMFQGGTQLPGLKEPGYPESYDFQAPLSEFGFIRHSYKSLKILHHFIKDFGAELASMNVVEPDNPVLDELNTKDLRYVARANGNGGFLFLNNTQVRVPMPDKIFRMKLNLENEVIEIPRKAMLLKGEKTAILPFNLELNGVLMKYATAQPMSKIKVGDKLYLFFVEVEGMDVEIAFQASSIKDISADGWKKEADSCLIYLTPNSSKSMEITSVEGIQSTIVILTRQEAENSWRTNINGQESLIITKADLLSWDGNLELRQMEDAEFTFDIFPTAKEILLHDKKELLQTKNDIFSNYRIDLSEVQLQPEIKKQSNRISMIKVPTSLPVNLSDVVLNIDYLGGGAKMLVDGKIVTDHLYYGPSWQVGLKRYIQNQNHEIQLEIQDWSNSITGISDTIEKQIKKEGAKIQKIEVLAQYKVKINLN